MKLTKLTFCLLALFLAGCRTSPQQMQEAILSDDAEAVKAALAKWDNINGPLPDERCVVDKCAELTPLIVATLGARGLSAIALLEAGADPNARDASGATALHYAVLERNIHITDILLRFKADPNIMVEVPTPGVRNWRLPLGDRPLIIAAFRRNTRAVERLLQHGAQVDAKDRYQRTALWYLDGKLTPQEEKKLDEQTREIRRLLLKAGANPDPRDHLGKRPERSPLR
jgi:hypothetical protein